MEELKFCPKCGKATLQWDGEKKMWCDSCEFLLFQNVAGAVAVILRCGDELLLTRRNQQPKKNKLDLPGGFTDPRESAEQTCARELAEELQLEIDTAKLKYLASDHNIYAYRGIIYHTLDLFYEYNFDEKVKTTAEQSEISEVLWLKVSEVPLEDLAFESQRKFLRAYAQKN